MITILGDGAFGTALAHLCATKGHTVTLWCNNPHAAHSIKTTRKNSVYLPSIMLPENIVPVTDLNEAFTEAQWVIEAVPIKYVRSVLERARPSIDSKIPWILASKGIETGSLLCAQELLNSVVATEVPSVILSGPSFAIELATKQPTAVMLASSSPLLREKAAALLTTDYFSVKLSSDTKGIELCGALKNIIALAIGMIEGAGYGQNTKALVFTCALAELSRLLIAYAGTDSALYTLAGIGDCILTATPASRNYTVGSLIGKGTYAHLTTSEAEGINTLVSIHELSKRLHVTLPLFTKVYDVLFNKEKIEALIQACK